MAVLDLQGWTRQPLGCTRVRFARFAFGVEWAKKSAQGPNGLGPQTRANESEPHKGSWFASQMQDPWCLRLRESAFNINMLDLQFEGLLSGLLCLAGVFRIQAEPA